MQTYNYDIVPTLPTYSLKDNISFDLSTGNLVQGPSSFGKTRSLLGVSYNREKQQFTVVLLKQFSVDNYIVVFIVDYDENRKRDEIIAFKTGLFSWIPKLNEHKFKKLTSIVNRYDFLNIYSGNIKRRNDYCISNSIYLLFTIDKNNNLQILEDTNDIYLTYNLNDFSKIYRISIYKLNPDINSIINNLKSEIISRQLPITYLENSPSTLQISNYHLNNILESIDSSLATLTNISKGKKTSSIEFTLFNTINGEPLNLVTGKTISSISTKTSKKIFFKVEMFPLKFNTNFYKEEIEISRNPPGYHFAFNISGNGIGNKTMDKDSEFFRIIFEKLLNKLLDNFSPTTSALFLPLQQQFQSPSTQQQFQSPSTQQQFQPSSTQQQFQPSSTQQYNSPTQQFQSPPTQQFQPLSTQQYNPLINSHPNSINNHSTIGKATTLTNKTNIETLVSGMTNLKIKSDLYSLSKNDLNSLPIFTFENKLLKTRVLQINDNFLSVASQFILGDQSFISKYNLSLSFNKQLMIGLVNIFDHLEYKLLIEIKDGILPNVTGNIYINKRLLNSYINIEVTKIILIIF